MTTPWRGAAGLFPAERLAPLFVRGRSVSGKTGSRLFPETRQLNYLALAA
jgi:hypothetical protein